MFMYNLKAPESQIVFLKSCTFESLQKNVDDTVHCEGPMGILKRVEGVIQVHVKTGEMKH